MAAPLSRTREDGVPRRACIHLLTPAETAIREAVLAVELVGGDPRLTEIVIMLGQAREKLADYLEGLAP